MADLASAKCKAEAKACCKYTKFCFALQGATLQLTIDTNNTNVELGIELEVFV